MARKNIKADVNETNVYVLSIVPASHLTRAQLSLVTWLLMLRASLPSRSVVLYDIS